MRVAEAWMVRMVYIYNIVLELINSLFHKDEYKEYYYIREPQITKLNFG